MEYIFKCAYCGKENSIEWRRGTPKHRFCDRKCAAKWRTENGMFRPVRREGYPGALPHDDVRILITQEIPLFPEFRPNVGDVYDAELYFVRGGGKKSGYVIVVNGHRVNIRIGECLEVG